MQAPVSEPHFYIDPEKPHLGGYIPGGDDATYYPDLWSWLVNIRKVKSVIDVGCGEGHALNWFLDHGCAVLGIDGVVQPLPSEIFRTHDYTVYPLPERIGPTLWPDIGRFDIAWCCEFVEHIEEHFVPNFLATFATADLVLMTHAEPGQLGHHHVNCQRPDYWQGAMAAIGYELDLGLTNQTRVLASMNLNPYNHYARSGLAFVRYEQSAS